MKRLSLLVEAAIPHPPSVEDFVAALRKAGCKLDAQVDALLGDLPAQDEEPRHFCKTYKAASKAFLDYISVCEAHGVQHSTLDECFLGWARWTIDAKDFIPVLNKCRIALSVEQPRLEHNLSSAQCRLCRSGRTSMPSATFFAPLPAPCPRSLPPLRASSHSSMPS